MAKITLNFDDVETFEPVPEGAYQVVVEEVKIRDSQNSEHPYLNWKVSITEGDNVGRFLWIITSFNPKALFKLQEMFGALGLQTEGIADIEIDDDTAFVISPELVGLPFTAIVTNEMYQGKEQNRVNNFMPAENGGKKGGKSGKSYK